MFTGSKYCKLNASILNSILQNLSIGKLHSNFNYTWKKCQSTFYLCSEHSEINKRTLSLWIVFVIHLLFCFTLILLLLIQILHTLISYIFDYCVLVVILRFVSSHSIFIMVTVFAGTPSQKGQHINTFRVFIFLCFCYWLWSCVCCISIW